MGLQNMRDAVQIIGRATGLADLAPNASGAFELIFLGKLPVYFQVVGDNEIEIQIRLQDRQPLTSAMMTAMLAANLDLRHGRLAVEPGGDRVVYCGRLNIASHDQKTLMPAVTAIIREGGALRIEGFAALGQKVAAANSTAGVLSETLIRV